MKLPKYLTVLVSLQTLFQKINIWYVQMKARTVQFIIVPREIQQILTATNEFGFK